MRKRGKQGPPDFKEIAYRVVNEAFGEEPANEGKTPAAVELGRLGG